MSSGRAARLSGMPEIAPNLWFDTEAEEAAAFYCSVFPNSRVTSVAHYTEAGPREAGTVMTVAFELDGKPFVAINGGPDFTFNEAVSLEIRCADQDEVDRFWDALTSDGGAELPCGWCKDRFGVAWQVTPPGMEELFNSGDAGRVERAMQAMFTMTKLDGPALLRAADGEAAPA